jgi:beta-lactamase superfamily II metal-dependent hydrolase
MHSLHIVERIRATLVAAPLILAGCATPPEATSTQAAAASGASVMTAEIAAAPAAGASSAAAAAVQDAYLDVWVLDVGQGSCVIVDCPNGDRPLIIDCGSTARSRNNDRDLTLSAASDLVERLGAPTVVVSHGDEDHYGLIARVVEPADVVSVWLGGSRAAYGDFTDWLDDVEAAGKSVGTLPVRFSAADDSDLHCGSATVDILIANATAGATKNGDSIVLGVSYGGVTLVLPGDAEGPTEAQALAFRNSHQRLLNNQSIVIGSHHGADTSGSNGEAWAKAWAPIAAVFSMTPGPFKHPRCEVAERYAKYMPRRPTLHRFTCGRKNTIGSGATVTSMQASRRLLSTHDNGDLLIRVRPSTLSIYCQTPSTSCSGEIPGG